MTKAVDRQEWVRHGLRLLAEGSYLAEITIDEASRQLGVTKGSFTHYFRNADDWYGVVLASWSEARRQQRKRDAQYVQLIRDPLDRLRALRRRAAESPAGDAAMRNWAATAAGSRPVPGAIAAAAALEEVREEFSAEVSAALCDLGLAHGEPELMTEVLLREFGSGPGDPSVPLGDDAGFDLLLGILARSVRSHALTTAELEIPASEGDPGATVMVIVAQPQGGKALDREALAAAADFVRKKMPGLLNVPDGAGQDRVTASQRLADS
jgi:AcrR family transcriptional regulator